MTGPGRRPGPAPSAARRPGARPGPAAAGTRGRGARAAPAWRRPCPHRPSGVTQAEAHCQQALTLADQSDMRPLVAYCNRGLGTRYATTVQRDQAHAELSTAIEM